MIAKTFKGLENVLAKELELLNATDIEILNRAVSFSGNKELLYKANFHLRTALKILVPIKKFKANNEHELYKEVKKIRWAKYLELEGTFAVDSVVNSEIFTHSKYVAYKVKDAIVDQYRENFNIRPSVNTKNPSLQINIHISENNCSLSIDSSGESLHKRGYRLKATEAPLNEVLAAGMIYMSEWDKKSTFVDPMCGSGTLLIEAALIANNIPPGL
ncbi:MAG: THUMP domain-containing protein, partial [Bacteroidota bacterium]|nr:THUMP domain-containing protein [Bacteroidota bacterium]